MIITPSQESTCLIVSAPKFVEVVALNKRGTSCEWVHVGRASRPILVYNIRKPTVYYIPQKVR